MQLRYLLELINKQALNKHGVCGKCVLMCHLVGHPKDTHHIGVHHKEHICDYHQHSNQDEIGRTKTCWNFCFAMLLVPLELLLQSGHAFNWDNHTAKHLAITTIKDKKEILQLSILSWLAPLIDGGCRKCSTNTNCGVSTFWEEALCQERSEARLDGTWYFGIVVRPMWRCPSCPLSWKATNSWDPFLPKYFPCRSFEVIGAFETLFQYHLFQFWRHGPSSQAQDLVAWQHRSRIHARC